MKKFILILVLAVTCVAINAQLTAVTKPLKSFTADEYIYNYTGTSIDTLGVVRDSILIPVFINKIDGNYYDFKTVVHEVVSPARVTVKLMGKKFASDAWSAITTVIYTGVGTDSTIYFTQTSSKQFYNYYQVEYLRNSNKASITYLNAVIKK